MKRIVIIILALLLFCNSYGQKINFTDTSNQWIVTTSYYYPGKMDDRWETIYRKYYYRDTAYRNGIQYQRLWLYNSKNKYDAEIALVRYDSTENKVYYYSPDGDYVLYDYNLSVGDTVYPFYTNINYHPNLYSTVVTVDSLLINNVYHKRFYVKVTDTSFIDLHGTAFIFIEGVGCTTGPLDALDHAWTLYRTHELNRFLKCFKNQGDYKNIPPWTSGQQCSDYGVKKMLSIEPSPKVINITSLYPQPATGYFKIDLTEAISGALHIYNSLGQVVCVQEVKDESTIHFNNKNNMQGLYFYKISTDSGNSISGKVIFQ